MSPIYILDEHDAAQIKALLTLAADGLADQVLDGTEQEKAAVTLGRLLGRTPAQLVLTCRGDERRYDWPAEWERAVTDHARATAAGAAVEARQDAAGGSGPPTRERRPQARGADLRADVTVRRGCDTGRVTLPAHDDEAGAPAICIPDVDAYTVDATTGGGLR